MMTPLRRSHVGSQQNDWIVWHAQIRLPGGGYVFLMTDKLLVLMFTLASI